MTGWALVAGDVTPHGGMDRANLALATHLAGRGPLHVVAHRIDPELELHPNVAVRRVARPLGKHMLGAPLLALAGRAAARRLGPGTRVVVNGGNCRWPDVNWVHCVHSAFPPPAAGGPLRRLKTRLHHALACRDERAAVRVARVVVCNSRRTARDVVELLGADPARVRVVYLGTDPERFPVVTPAERAAARSALGWDDRPWVGFVGQLGNRVKNFDTLYDAWRGLCRDARWDANLAVVGSGATLSAWEARAKADGLAGRVRFLGYRSDLPVVLAGCDATAHPARYDAYGLAAHEALCRGLPTIVSAAAGVAERYPAALGGLVLADPEDAAALAARLRDWRQDLEAWPARVAGLAEALRRRTWDDMAAEFVSVVGEVPA